MAGPFYFAWAGGIIQEQTTVVTNGSTHGALFTTVALVGDVTSGQRQLISLANTSGLDIEAYYELSGPGIPAGTRFIFDDTILSGRAGSVNLSAATTSTQRSATFEAKKAVSLGVGLATLTDGSASLTLTDVGDLPAGTYGVFGTGIGETDVPIGTTTGTSITTGGGILIVGAALLVYNGAGGGSLAILAATPHTTTGTDEFGETTNVTTYTIAQQPVRATVSGVYPLQITGFPSADPASVSGIPATALGGLEAGLVYNISGNGIPLGATFVAPTSGTSITLDLNATASDLNAILTITGPRTPNAPFNPAVHNRFDEEVVSVEIAQEEGGFATLTVAIKNPNIGLLALGRNLWCWLSWDQAWPDGTPALLPLFNGRLIGVPKLTAGEIVQLQFLARPDDLNAQKTALADSLKVLPYFDPVWLATSVTPDTVLETYSALWHVHPVPLAVTISDIIVGEAGTVEIGEGVSIYDRFALSYAQPPIVAAIVTGTVSWQQQAEGVLDITQTLLDAFYASGSAYKTTNARGATTATVGFHLGQSGSQTANWSPVPLSQAHWDTGGGGLIQTLGDGLFSAWPKAGNNIGGGWSLSNLVDDNGVPLCYIHDASTTGGGWLKPLVYTLTYSAPIQPDTTTTTTTVTPINTALVTQTYGTYTVDWPLNVYKTRMSLEFRANRKRTETITAVVSAGVQRELSDSAESDRESISMTSQYVDQGVDANGALPIGNVSYRSYFQTARGASSFEYLLLAARAKIRARARAVDISFAVDWHTALGITLRHNVRYTDRRVPGGVAVGKVKSYRLTAGTAGMLGEFVIGCTIGTGDSTAPLAGTNSYVNPGYVNVPPPGYQVVAGGQSALLTDEIAYQTLDNFVIVDDGLDLPKLSIKTAVNECRVTNGLTTQLTALDKYQNTKSTTIGDPLYTVDETSVTLDLKPVAGGEFHTDFFPAITPLALPKTIDLSAA